MVKPPAHAPSEGPSPAPRRSTGPAPYEILIVTGSAGSGKTTAIRAAEDAGYLCVDNLPVSLVADLVKLLQRERRCPQIALGMDLRDQTVLEEAPALVAQLRQAGHHVRVLFLDAEQEVLLRRFSQTRRLHPLDAGTGLRAAIEKEHRLLDALRELADEILDTSALTPHSLRHAMGERLANRAHPQSGQTMHISVLSFGFKNGVPTEADMLFDVRFLPNPYFVPELSPKSGMAADVADYVLKQPQATQLLQHLEALLLFLLPQYQAENKRYFTLAIGCTGGRHRSVAIAARLVDVLSARGMQAELRHRDMASFVAVKEGSA